MRFLGHKYALVLILAWPCASLAGIAGKAVQVSGDVLIRNEDAANPRMRRLKPGDVIEAGTVVNTGSAATAKIMLEDRSIIDLGASTMFKIDEYVARQEGNRTARMSLGFGKIRASVNTPVGPRGRFTIRTRSVTMGVRGTEFVVLSDLGSDVPSAGKALSTDTGKTQVTVIHGKVTVNDERSGKALSEPLTSGQQLTTVTSEPTPEEPSRAPAAVAEMVELPAEKIEEVRREAKQDYGTFNQAVALDRSGEASSGSQTLAAIAQDFALPEGYVPSVGEMGFPGTFDSDFGLDSNVNRLVAMPIRLKVVFIR